MNPFKRKPEPIFFIHIGKTGGISFEHILRENFKPSRICEYYYDNEFLEAPSSKLDYDVFLGHNWYFAKSIMPPVMLTTFIREPVQRLFSAYEHIIRDSSHYQHQQMIKEVKSPKDFLEVDSIRKSNSNAQTRILGSDFDFKSLVQDVRTGKISKEDGARKIHQFRLNSQATPEMLETAKRRLSKMKAFGITDRFDESAKWAAKVFHLKIKDIPKLNSSPSANKNRKDIYSEADFQAAEELNKFDRELYSYANRIFRG